ncbi:MAG: UpxY family transcription antiterminator [Mediterranea massiliensis]|nr:UpxY family transcription antiterminator [Mediterranea massiliensis]
MKDEQREYWYALSAPYCKELEAKRLLDREQVENFLPMQYKVITGRDGKKRRELVPAIHNLLFARTNRVRLQEIKSGVRYIQYRTRPEAGRNIPIIVPDRQMEQFMAISRTMNEKLLYLRPEEINLAKGTRVRIIGGPFDGVEGIFVKVQGVRSKRVVVQIEGLMAVAAATIHPDLIQVIE